MTEKTVADLYRQYISCLNDRVLDQLGDFVAQDVFYNGRSIGLSGYRAMLERDFRDIPDLQFTIQILVADPSSVATRLSFDCTPRDRFKGLDIDGRRVSFSEHAIYEYEAGKIRRVWSVLDKAEIEAQLSEPSA